MKNRIIVVGHRGCAGLLPENTLSAFKHAFELGVDAIEFDVHLTADDQVVIYHDYHINPIITHNQDDSWVDDPGQPICKRSYSEISQYKLGKIKPDIVYNAKYPAVQNSIDEPIPTIEDLFDLAKKYPNVQLQIEIKTRSDQPQISSDHVKLTEAVIKKIQQYGYQKRTAILSFDWRSLIVAHNLSTNIPLYFIYEKKLHVPSPDATWFAGYSLKNYNNSVPTMIAAMGGNFWSVRNNEITSADVNEAHKHGLMVNVWSTNTAEEFKEAISKGVDAITTDRPDILIEILKNYPQ